MSTIMFAFTVMPKLACWNIPEKILCKVKFLASWHGYWHVQKNKINLEHNFSKMGTKNSVLSFIIKQMLCDMIT